MDKINQSVVENLSCQNICSCDISSVQIFFFPLSFLYMSSLAKSGWMSLVSLPRLTMCIQLSVTSRGTVIRYSPSTCLQLITLEAKLKKVHFKLYQQQIPEHWRNNAFLKHSTSFFPDKTHFQVRPKSTGQDHD